MLEWFSGFAMGVCLGVVPTAFAMGSMYQQSLSARNRAEVVRELHKAVVDVGGRISTWMKGKTNGKTELEAPGAAHAGAAGLGGGHGVAHQGAAPGGRAGGRSRTKLKTPK
jgi:hypothetical protein